MIPTELPRAWRWALFALFLLLGAVLLLVLVVQWLQFQALLMEQLLWQRWAIAGLVLGVLGGLAWLLARLLLVRAEPETAPRSPTVDRATVEERLRTQAERGADVTAAQAELQELDQRNQAGVLTVAAFGEVSTGKSALLSALLPGADLHSDVLAGTTRHLNTLDWSTPAGNTVRLVDMPGLQDLDRSLEPVALDEARRAHLVLFVAQGDLNRTEWRWFQLLRDLQRPMLLVLNKSDRYSRDAMTAIRDRVQERVGSTVPVVVATAGGTQTVHRRLPEGTEDVQLRPRPADVRVLRRELQRLLDRDAATLTALRDESVFLLAATKLEQAVRGQRRDAADALVERYARRAVVGALAAVAPGTDLLIQGALAAIMVRELAGLYNVPVRSVQVDSLLAALQGRASATRPVVMGIAGNACKAFPGVGTIAGGLIHAVAYGLLFRTVGMALIQVLEEDGRLDERRVLERFEELTRDDLAAPARQLAHTAVEEARAGRERHANNAGG